MSDSKRIGAILVALAACPYIAGCPVDPDNRTENSPNVAAEDDTGVKKSAEQAPMTDLDRAEEVAKDLDESGRSSMDVLRPGDPNMVYAHYDTVTFDTQSADLDESAESSLRDLVASLDDEKPAYVTVRMEDDDTLDVTPPDSEFAALTADRAAVVRKFLEREGIKIEEFKVDEAGVVETPGEQKGLARSDPSVDPDQAQQVVVTIAAH